MNLNFKPYEISLIKIATVAFVFLLINLLPGLSNWVMNTHWAVFVVVFVVASIKPFMTMFGK